MYTTDPKIQEATVTVQTRPHRRVQTPAEGNYYHPCILWLWWQKFHKCILLRVEPEVKTFPSAAPIVQPLRLWKAVKTTFVCMSWCLLPVKKRLSSPSLVKLVTTSTASCKILLKFLGMVSILILSKFKWQCHLKNLRFNLRFFILYFFYIASSYNFIKSSLVTSLGYWFARIFHGLVSKHWYVFNLSSNFTNCLSNSNSLR